MSATQIDLDDEALTATMRLSGARTKKDAVNLALREYAQRAERGQARVTHRLRSQRWDEDDFWRRHEEEKADR